MNRNTKRMRFQGFTLIEMVSVIVILGILSAYALPKFADLKEDSLQAIVQGTGDAFRSGVKIARGKWVAGGYSGPVSNLDVFEGSSRLIDMNANGWPAQVFSGVEANPTANNTFDCYSLWDALLTDGAPSIGTTLSPDYDFVVYYSGGNICSYHLVERFYYRFVYDTNTGEVDIFTIEP